MHSTIPPLRARVLNVFSLVGINPMHLGQCVSCNFQNKRRLFPETWLTDLYII